MTDTLGATVDVLLARERELSSLSELLSRARLVTLTGPAGVGKSRIAAALAAEERWTACSAADLAGRDDPGRDDPASRLGDALAQLPVTSGPCLLLIDNCDLFLGDVALFASRALAARAGLRIVATSRECLGSREETVYPVRPLSDADAARFFVARAGAHHGGVIPEITPEIVRICARLDGLPLALELAAARTTVLTPAQILTRLDDPIRLLVGGTHACPARHRSLRDALDWGTGTLVAHQAVLLRRLSVFADAFTLETAEEVCSGTGLGVEDVLPALAGLVAKSLVSCDPNGTQARYRLMRVVRRYAGQMLAESGEAEVVQRSRARHASEHPDALSVPDLAESLRWCADHGSPGDGLRLAAAAAPFWLLSGRIPEGAALLSDAIARDAIARDGEGPAPDGGQDASSRGRALAAKGMFDWAAGQFTAAAEAAAAAADECARSGDCTGRLWAGILSGMTELDTAPHAAARRIASAAAELPGDSPWAPVAAALHAVAASEAGLPAEAQDASVRALAMAGTGTLDAAAAAAALAAARVAREQGHLDQARALLDEAPSSSGILRAMLLTESCRLCLDQGTEDGESQLDRAVALASETGSPLLMASVLDVAGQARLRQGHAQAAKSAFARVTALSTQTGTAHAVAGILGLGQVALASGSASAAWTLIDEAHSIAREGAGPALLARTLQAVGDCAWALGDASRAWTAYHGALGRCIDAGVAVMAVVAVEALACLAIEQDRTEYGVRLLGAAEGLREAQGSARSPAAQSRFDAVTATASQSLSASRFAELHAEGRRLSLQEAAAYAGRQRGPRQRGVGWVSLTPTERQVADLAATGLTNREIGQRLFSSPRTVQAHLSHVFAKLGISSRKMLAAEIQARNKQLPLRVSGSSA